MAGMNMKVLKAVVVMTSVVLSSQGLLLDNLNPTVLPFTAVHLTTPDLCNLDALLACYGMDTSNLTSPDFSATFDKFCGPKAQQTFNCMRHALGNALSCPYLPKNLQNLLSQNPHDNPICRDKATYQKLATCTKVVTQYVWFPDCVIGKEDNITLDYNDICVSTQQGLRCIVKGMRAECPGLIDTYVSSTLATYNLTCTLNIDYIYGNKTVAAMTTVAPTVPPVTAAIHTGTGQTSGQRSLLLSVLTNIEQQAETLEQFAHSLAVQTKAAKQMV